MQITYICINLAVLPLWEQECFLLCCLRAIFLSLLWVPSSCPSQEFSFTDCSCSLLCGQHLIKSFESAFQSMQNSSFKTNKTHLSQVTALFLPSTLTLKFSISEFHSPSPSHSLTHFKLPLNLCTSNEAILLNCWHPCCSTQDIF